MRNTFLLFVLGLIIVGMSQTSRLCANEADHDHASNQSGLVSHVEYRPLTPEDIERFHGHLGPNVLMGVRMGEHACGVAGIPRYFGLTVVVECPDGPPPTCLIDGLQISCGATMGKENISHKTAERVQVTFKDNATGKTVVYRPKDSTREMIKKWASDKVRLHDQSMYIYEMKPEDLFEIETTPAK